MNTDDSSITTTDCPVGWLGVPPQWLWIACAKVWSPSIVRGSNKDGTSMTRDRCAYDA